MNDFNMAASGPWSLGTLIWLPTCVIIVALLSLFAIWLRRNDEAPFDIVVWVFAAAVVGGTLSPVGMYPYRAEYHQWRDVSGTVQTIDKRLVSDGDSMQEKFVVVFADSGGAQFGCDDTRCAAVAGGDALKLSCKRVWQYTGTDGYDCRFVSTEAS